LKTATNCCRSYSLVAENGNKSCPKRQHFVAVSGNMFVAVFGDLSPMWTGLLVSNTLDTFKRLQKHTLPD